MSKGEKLILLVSGEVSISPNLLMDDSNFVKQAKKLISQKDIEISEFRNIN